MMEGTSTVIRSSYYLPNTGTDTTDKIDVDSLYVPVRDLMFVCQ